MNDIDKGIAAARNGDYLAAMNLLMDAYNGGQFSMKGPRSAEALSYYGLCIGLVQRKYKLAIEFCQKAIEMNFYWPDHYTNLAKVYVAASMKRKAVETLDKGLSMFPEDKPLRKARLELGVRSRSSVPFLERDNPINKVLGRTRHSAKVAARKRKVRNEK